MLSDIAWLIPLLPALSAGVIAAVGRQLPKKGAEVGIAAVGVALLLSAGVAVEVFGANVRAVAALEEEHGQDEHDQEEHARGGVQVASLALPPAMHAAAAGEAGAAAPEGVSAFLNERSLVLADFGGPAPLEAGIRVDGLAAMMFLLVTAVSLMVQVYSTGYMHGDPRYTYYFSLLSLFTASMLLLVIANNMLMLLVGWELVGLCSFLLIGFWWEEKVNQDAAIKAFLTTKFGDVGLVVGVVMLFGMFGTFNIGDILAAVEQGDYSQGLLTTALLALFLGAVGKSAQFPLSTWLPDAMAGPTPVSALIHAATMVTAGIFLVARLYPLYQASTVALAVVAVIGTITLVSAGLLAIVQDDVKRVLAYSTVSQLGYMIAALAFSYTAGIFHLFTHGFFKALLFLGAGSLIHAVHSNNMSDMGGLKRFMPVTFWTFAIGSAALAALPPLAGFWSKDEVLAGALSAGGATGWLLVVLGTLGGGLTAFYMARVLWLVFAGEFRGHGQPHESPLAMRWPLVVLAVPAALVGFVNLPFDAVHPYGFAAWTAFDLEYFAGHPAHFFVLLALASTLLGVAGIALGTALYRQVPATDPTLRLGWVSRVLVNKYYLDDLYTDLITRSLVRTKLANAAYWLNDHVIDRLVFLSGVGTARFSRGLYDGVDQRGIDGAVNGLAGGANLLGREVFRKFQSGNVQLYAGGMFLGVFVLAVAFALAA